MQGDNRPTGLLSSYSSIAPLHVLSCCTEANTNVLADCTLRRCYVHAGCASRRTRAAWTAGFRSSSRRRPHDTQPEPSVVSTTGLIEQPPHHHPVVTTHLRGTKSTSIPRDVSSQASDNHALDAPRLQASSTLLLAGSIGGQYVRSRHDSIHNSKSSPAAIYLHPMLSPSSIPSVTSSARQLRIT
jgi:hypothetical protein